MDDEIRLSGCRSSGKVWEVRAGKLGMIYENGSLRRISAGKTEIIRMIYSAIRNSAWLTIYPLIEDEQIEIRQDSFHISFNCLYKAVDIDFKARYCIDGRNDNTLIFKMDGFVQEKTVKNRIGFCVLHPVEGYAGTKCKIIHHDTVDESCFPVHISPHQPFTDIKAMNWEIGGLSCRLDLNGDTFETEDQRNWTDASYKTYCTPLNRPFPVTLEKGEEIHQEVKLTVTGDLVDFEKDERIKISIFPEVSTDLPVIGIGRSSRNNPITKQETALLKGLHFNHYRADLFLFEPGWKEMALQAAAEASDLGSRLEYVLFFDDNYKNQCNEFISFASAIKDNILVITILHKNFSTTPDFVAGYAAQKIKRSLGNLKICYGTNANFAQLNRNRPTEQLNDLICYSVHPQEHASDIKTLVENLYGQKYTVESARQFAGSKGIWISPVNIQRRFNANKSTFEIPEKSARIPSQVDSRLLSIFGASWITASLKYLAETGVAGITFLETVGERGIIQGEHPSQWPEEFPSFSHMIFPVFHIFKYILGLRNCRVIKSTSSQPLKVEVLAIKNKTGIKILLLNMTSEVQIVFSDDLKAGSGIKKINAASFEEAVNNPEWLEIQSDNMVNDKVLQLEPFSISFIG